MGIEDIYESIQACTEIKSNYNAMEAEVWKIGLSLWLLLFASVEGLVLPRMIDQEVRMGELHILFINNINNIHI